MDPLPAPPGKQPADLSIGDGFSFGCGFVIASIVASIGLSIGVLLWLLLLGVIAGRSFLPLLR
ncbi:MAG: hypothetical protein ACP5SI_10625 [Chloroflexia bacterium]